MALRIAVGFVTALRALLIYGEAARLATQPVQAQRFRGVNTLPIAVRRSSVLVDAVTGHRAPTDVPGARPCHREISTGVESASVAP